MLPASPTALSSRPGGEIAAGGMGTRHNKLPVGARAGALRSQAGAEGARAALWAAQAATMKSQRSACVKQQFVVSCCRAPRCHKLLPTSGAWGRVETHKRSAVDSSCPALPCTEFALFLTVFDCGWKRGPFKAALQPPDLILALSPSCTFLLPGFYTHEPKAAESCPKALQVRALGAP